MFTKEESVFHHLARAPAPAGASELMAKWTRLAARCAIRYARRSALRAEGKVGSSLQAEVDFGAAGEDYELLASLGDDLKFLLLTSAARIRRTGEREVKVRASEHPKCERCWHYRADVNEEALCARCQSNLRGAGEVRRHV